MSDQKQNGFFQIASTQEGGASPSTDVAEFLDTADAVKTSKGSVSNEQEQLLRLVEPDEWALKVKAKPIPEITCTTTARHA